MEGLVRLYRELSGCITSICPARPLNRQAAGELRVSEGRMVVFLHGQAIVLTGSGGGDSITDLALQINAARVKILAPP